MDNRFLPAIVVSVTLHAAVFGLGEWGWVKSAQFAVDEGIGGVEIQLQAASAREEMSALIREKEQPPEDMIKEKPPVKVEAVKPQEAQPKALEGKDEQSVSSKSGALTEKRPDYLSNPAPVYPREARRLKQEGLVVLSVEIDPKGKPVKISIIQSTGSSLLDQAAVTAVRRWVFSPAGFAGLAIHSTVEIPIRFRLDKEGG